MKRVLFDIGHRYFTTSMALGLENPYILGGGTILSYHRIIGAK